MDLDLDTLMAAALRLARPHHPHPNPRVGALVVAPDGEIVGRGAHTAAGGPHAERMALDEAGEAAAGATVVVTLEPCNHHGATPPCVDAVVAAGVERVVVGAVDPDRRVCGAGLAAMRAAGVEVVEWADPASVEAIDPGYFHHRRTGRPLVTLKLALTLDGQAAAADGSSQWITSPAARRDAHELRARSDAVAIGAGTVLVDDPRLDVRLDGYEGPQPRPVVVRGARSLPGDARVMERDPLVYRPDGGARVELDEMLGDLGGRGIVDLLVEGGPTLATSFERANLVDRYVLYLAGAIAGGTGRAAFDGIFPTMGTERRVEITGVRAVGPDVRLDCRSRR